MKKILLFFSVLLTSSLNAYAEISTVSGGDFSSLQEAYDYVSKGQGGVCDDVSKKKDRYEFQHMYKCISNLNPYDFKYAGPKLNKIGQEHSTKYELDKKGYICPSTERKKCEVVKDTITVQRKLVKEYPYPVSQKKAFIENANRELHAYANRAYTQGSCRTERWSIKNVLTGKWYTVKEATFEEKRRSRYYKNEIKPTMVYNGHYMYGAHRDFGYIDVNSANYVNKTKIKINFSTTSRDEKIKNVKKLETSFFDNKNRGANLYLEHGHKREIYVQGSYRAGCRKDYEDNGKSGGIAGNVHWWGDYAGFLDGFDHITINKENEITKFEEEGYKAVFTSTEIIPPTDDIAKQVDNIIYVYDKGQKITFKSMEDAEKYYVDIPNFKDYVKKDAYGYIGPKIVEKTTDEYGDFKVRLTMIFEKKVQDQDTLKCPYNDIVGKKLACIEDPDSQRNVNMQQNIINELTNLNNIPYQHFSITDIYEQLKMKHLILDYSCSNLVCFTDKNTNWGLTGSPYKDKNQYTPPGNNDFFVEKENLDETCSLEDVYMADGRYITMRGPADWSYSATPKAGGGYDYQRIKPGDSQVPDCFSKTSPSDPTDEDEMEERQHKIRIALGVLTAGGTELLTGLNQALEGETVGGTEGTKDPITQWVFSIDNALNPGCSDDERFAKLSRSSITGYNRSWTDKSWRNFNIHIGNPTVWVVDGKGSPVKRTLGTDLSEINKNYDFGYDGNCIAINHYCIHYGDTPDSPLDSDGNDIYNCTQDDVPVLGYFCRRPGVGFCCYDDLFNKALAKAAREQLPNVYTWGEQVVTPGKNLCKPDRKRVKPNCKGVKIVDLNRINLNTENFKADLDVMVKGEVEKAKKRINTDSLSKNNEDVKNKVKETK